MLPGMQEGITTRNPQNVTVNGTRVLPLIAAPLHLDPDHPKLAVFLFACGPLFEETGVVVGHGGAGHCLPNRNQLMQTSSSASFLVPRR
jgi:hypothetical protein